MSIVVVVGSGGGGKGRTDIKHKITVNIFTFRVNESENHKGSIMTDTADERSAEIVL